MATWSASHARCNYSCILPWNVLQVCQHVPSSEGCYQPYQASEGEGQGNQQQGETQRKEEKDRIFLSNKESKHPHFPALLKHFVCWDIYSLLLHCEYYLWTNVLSFPISEIFYFNSWGHTLKISILCSPTTCSWRM